jgi:hypothetical protein
VIGNNYDKINRAVSILISYPVLIEETREFHHRFRLYDERTKIRYPDSLEINVLEVEKAVQSADNSPLADWLRFFAAETTVASSDSSRNPARGAALPQAA